MDQRYIIQNYKIGTDELESFREIFKQVQYLTPRVYDHVSRYTLVRRLRDKDTGKLYHENWIKKGVSVSDSDNYFTVTIREKDRLDIIANDYYNTPKFWWMIAIANNIIDPFDVPVGTRLRVPDALTFYESGGILSGN